MIGAIVMFRALIWIAANVSVMTHQDSAPIESQSEFLPIAALLSQSASTSPDALR
jgi:hypothetical protein